LLEIGYHFDGPQLMLFGFVRYQDFVKPVVYFLQQELQREQV